MALLFCDSFEHYSGAQMARKWTNSLPTFGSIGGGARTGSQCLSVDGIGAQKTVVGGSGVSGCYPTITCGCAYQTQSFGNAVITFNYVIPGFGNTSQVALQHNGDGRLYNNPNNHTTPAIGPLSSFVMLTNTWYYFEYKVSISGSVMTCEARVNEAVILSDSFTLTGSPTAPGWTSFTVGGPGGGNHCLIDDVYVTDGEYLGDVRVYPLYPRADGDLSQWVPTSVGAHYLMVKEHPADDSTTIVSCSSANVGNVDEYYLDTLAGFSGTIKGAQACWLVEKSDAGDAVAQGTYRQNTGGTVVNGPSFHPSFTAWIYLLDPQRKSVFTAADWTPSEINAMQLGIKRTS
jgi:hypothetical protein